MRQGALKTAWRKSLKRIVVAAIAAVFAITLVGSGAWPFPNSGTSGTPESITIGKMPIEAHALINIAEDQGFFDGNGLNVTVRDYSTGPASANELLNGEVDIAVSGEYVVVGHALEKIILA